MSIAMSASETYGTDDFIAGSDPITHDVGTILLGQNLPARTPIGRVAASKKLVICDPAAVDGSEVPIGILVHAIDASTEEKTGQYYKSGCFFSSSLNWHAGFADAAQKKSAFDRTGVTLR